MRKRCTLRHTHYTTYCTTLDYNVRHPSSRKVLLHFFTEVFAEKFLPSQFSDLQRVKLARQHACIIKDLRQSGWVTLYLLRYASKEGMKSGWFALEELLQEVGDATLGLLVPAGSRHLGQDLGRRWLLAVLQLPRTAILAQDSGEKEEEGEEEAKGKKMRLI